MKEDWILTKASCDHTSRMLKGKMFLKILKLFIWCIFHMEIEVVYGSGRSGGGKED